jgi:hypothetical protein
MLTPQIPAEHAHYRIENKEQVVTFEPAIVIFMMMILVETPQKTMHNIFVREPGIELHDQKSGQKN